MMRLDQIMLIGQHSTKDIATATSSNVAVSISYAGTPSPEGKPWPYEITYTVQVFDGDRRPEPQDDDATDTLAPRFEAEVHYAAQFLSEEELSQEDSLETEAMLAWPYARADLVQLLRLHDMPTALIPAVPSLHPDPVQDEPEC